MTTPPSTLDHIRDLHERGLRPVAIAAKLGADVTPAEVRAALAEMGLDANQRARGPQVRPRSGLTSAERQALGAALVARTALLRMAARRVAAGATIEAAANELGLPPADVIEAARERRAQRARAQRLRG